MAEVKWTAEQLQAIEEKGKNILVSAGAGSGKTAVLVERMINKILNQGVDIDRILIVTFTQSAASEMRERILDAIYTRLEKEPDNKNLQRQIVLLNKANISTIHAFCLNVIKNNFFEIGISPDFRIAEPAEVELLKMEVLDELLEVLYENNDERIVRITDIYSGYRGDENLKSILLNIYNYIQSTPFPEEWLNKQVEKFNMMDKNFSDTEWAKILLRNYGNCIEEYISAIEKIGKKLEGDIDLQKYYFVIRDDIEKMKCLLPYKNDWDNTYTVSQSFKMAQWPVDKKIVSVTKDEARDERAEVRKSVKKLIESTFVSDNKQATEDIQDMYEVLNILKEIVFMFSENLSKAKQSKNIIDFNDIEHYALKILTKRDEEGNVICSDIAKKYMEKFDEIAIDEYQDSNEVQECILKSISNGKNQFMVGDVKQSIYKFRQARPELFLEKYLTYKLKDDLTEGDSLKILLANNFRSKEKILDFVNTLFANIMSTGYGEIDYTKDEYLNYKASYETIKQNEKIELHLIEDNESDDEEEIFEEIEKVDLEAKFVAKQIDQLMKSGYKVWEKNVGYRDIKYKDIVVLLRSPNAIASTFEKEFLDLNIPVFTDTNVKYLESIEIETIMNLLRIIDNPLQDIPLVAVMRSYIGGFTDNELIEIRLADRHCPFYEAILKVDNPKIESFLNNLKKWQFEQEYLPLDEFIWKIYLDTGYFNYVSLMPNGEFRQANLKMLFEQAKQYENASFKGLFNFIRFIENLKKNKGDLASAKLIGENENVVRIMSIHKSKGLEFPVVFLACTGKHFNLQDLKKEILLHQELGIGPQYTNYDRKITYDTLAKEAVKIQTRSEIIAEEMRVLYVALTRPKEKLFITGIGKKIPADLKNCMSFLDWIRFVYGDAGISENFEVKVYQKTRLEKEFGMKNEKDETSIKEILNKHSARKEEMEYISSILNWYYPYSENTMIESKTSVSSITKEKDEKLVEYEVPEFMKERTTISKAELGTLTHKVLQKLDFNREYSVEEIKELSQEVDANEIYGFLNSDIAKRARCAKKIFKEQPFYTYVKASDVYEVESEEPVLVQGIIDLFFWESDEIVLVDYKTDRVLDESILIERYKKQLLLYKKALEEACGKTVKEVYIYSTKLRRAIEIK